LVTHLHDPARRRHGCLFAAFDNYELADHFMISAITI
jgi:hypothetical protein